MKLILMTATLALAFSGTASAEKTRDIVTRVSEMKCHGEGHTVDLNWDTAISPLGPNKILLDGKDFPTPMMMGWEPDATLFSNPAKGFGFKINHKEAKKKKTFRQEVVVDGKPLQMNCAYKTQLKFLRLRDKESWEKPAPADPKREAIDATEIPHHDVLPDAAPGQQESGGSL